jgi:hypothetical protein
MVALSRVLQGISHPAQILSTAVEVDGSAYGWKNPPSVERSWSLVAEHGIGSLKTALGGIGLNSDEPEQAPLPQSFAWDRDKPAVYPDHVRLRNEEVAASLVLRRWPREVAPGWLGHALANLSFPVTVGIHITPQDPVRVARFLRKQQAWQTDTGPVQDAANSLGRQDAERVRARLVARADRPCRVAVVLTIRAKDVATLRQRVEDTKSEMTLTLADFREARAEQDRAFIATQPAARCDVVGAWKTLDCTSVASTWIFQPVTIRHARGADLGVTHESNMLVKLDPFDPSLRSFSGLLTGSVGSGKSYLLKLLLRHIATGVETRIVEHSDPPEYDGVPGLLSFNVADMNEIAQAEALRDYISELWSLARSNPRPRLLVLDELWSVLRRPELASLVEEIARRGRKYGLALWIATQQVEELVETGKAVFDNAAIKVYLQQEDRDLAGLAKAANLSHAARVLLRTAARGQALIQCGKMIVLVDVQSASWEHALITTDPRELWEDAEDGYDDDGDQGGQDRADRGVVAGPGLRGRDRARSGDAAVGAVRE